MRKKIVYLAAGVIFIILFIVGHLILSKIILSYQQRPAIETAEAYQVINQYKKQVIDFYQKNGYCPSLVNKKQIIFEEKAYTYIKTIRLLADKQNKICFITALMRNDTPSTDVKNKLLAIAYEVDRGQTLDWPCYTNIINQYTITQCRGFALPEELKQALDIYQQQLSKY